MTAAAQATAAAQPMMVGQPADAPLPALREDLQIMRVGASYSGAPTWVVFDPIRNRFFRITYEMFQVLSFWNSSRTVGNLMKSVDARFGNSLSIEDIGTIARMLEHNLLLVQPTRGNWRALHHKAQPHHPWFMRLIHNYLFFKIPLVRPERFIRHAWPHVSFLFGRLFWWVTALVGLLGLYLVSRQWDAFIGTFPFVFSLEGAAVSVLSIVFIKCLHELGHAFVAHRFGCRIPTMGVAFMVMVPLLYTDVSDAWKLKSRWQRLRIDSAGMLAELTVAAYALTLWAFVPDGPLRSALFVLAATGVVLSLFVNLNPFMRFDGYYILADLLGVENLQPRAFRHMRWRLREFLFRPGYSAPEIFPARLDVILTVYAVATAIYRLTLYLGIALLVYHFTIKLVGILLFMVEIGFFLVRPVLSEMKEWWAMRSDILKSRRLYLTGSVFALLVLLAFLPISTRVSAPAVIYPQQFVRLYPHEPGRIESVGIFVGQKVRAGDVLFAIDAPEIDEELRIAEVEAELARSRLARIAANPDDLAQRSIIESELGSLKARAEGLAERKSALVVTAPFDGVITDINPEILPGQWVGRNEQIAFLSAGTGSVARGYVAGNDSGRIAVEAPGWFIPDDLSLPRFPVTLAAIAESGAQEIDVPQLTSQYHGAIAVHAVSGGKRQRLAPVAAQYAVMAHVSETNGLPGRSLQGVMMLDAKGISFAEQAWRRVLTVLFREAGF
ncbi:site-2 protease family protein [Neorhizobium alkalisoli]|uniref:Putative peptide zinc metalloprotease protein n=1 Tax=Neorhizobium alkalisoli TaxID=528178 RepID=A0A561R9F6_9HYPH|nr:site-2 protease family protein [Neorhizobium alkalisoli]TWF59238.1 putative peptide zinc metalloprotease protein [Neorhizobium alkalisoli]